MPTKDKITWDLIGYGMPAHNEDYFKQLLDRHIPIVITENEDFGKIDIDGNAHNYNYDQSILILKYLLNMVRNASKDRAGHSMVQHGCKKERLSRLIEEYKNKNKIHSSFT